MEPRVQAICDLFVARSREDAGLHDYDGTPQDLSPAGVRAGLDRLGGAALADPVAEAHLAAFEAWARCHYGELDSHRRNPYVHLANLDVASYDRAYAPESERAAARRRHLEAWPDAVDAAVESLDRVPAPVAQALLPAIAGLAASLDVTDVAPRRAYERFVSHVTGFAEHGDPDPAIGATGLARLMGVPEAVTVDLGSLGLRCDAERDRMTELLRESCARIDPGRSPSDVVAEHHRDHPDAGGILAEAARQVAEVIGFTRDRDLVPYVDGECLVEPSPPSRRWAMAMMAVSAPYEDDAPSVYQITPPEPDWPAEEQEEWLQVFSATTLPGITVHEVAPGHFAHFRCLRRVEGDVRRSLLSMSFVEGWAHYAEELVLEEGFRAGDPRFPVGVALEALIRVTRLAAAIGIHTGAMTMAEAVHRFEADALLHGSAARSEAARATFDPGYGCYTFGKLEILALRERARAQWGPAYTHLRLHRALLEMGAPPLGLMESVLAG